MAKKFSTNLYKVELEDFKNSIQQGTVDQFIEGYIDNNQHANVNSKADVFSLVLNTALVLDDFDVIKYIFSLDLDNSILVDIDGLGRSPISRILTYGDEDLLDHLGKYIDAHKSDGLKSALHEEDQSNIIKALLFPKNESFDIDDYLGAYLMPLLTEDNYRKLVGSIEDQSTASQDAS